MIGEKILATKTITILEEAYIQLLNDKREDESFSDEIIRWAKMKKRPDLRQFAGMWSDMGEDSCKTVKKIIEKGWDTSFNKSLKEMGYKK